MREYFGILPKLREGLLGFRCRLFHRRYWRFEVRHADHPVTTVEAIEIRTCGKCVAVRVRARSKTGSSDHRSLRRS
jgi:hypothetical protein